MKPKLPLSQTKQGNEKEHIKNFISLKENKTQTPNFNGLVSVPVCVQSASPGISHTSEYLREDEIREQIIAVQITNAFYGLTRHLFSVRCLLTQRTQSCLQRLMTVWQRQRSRRRSCARTPPKARAVSHLHTLSRMLNMMWCTHRPRKEHTMGRGNAILMREPPPLCGGCVLLLLHKISLSSDRKKATWPTRVTRKKPGADDFLKTPIAFSLNLIPSSGRSQEKALLNFCASFSPESH